LLRMVIRGEKNTHPRQELGVSDVALEVVSSLGPGGGLATLLEYQRVLAVTKKDIPLVEGLIEEYEMNRIILVDPDAWALMALLQIRDPDQVSTGGYCTSDCDRYWGELVDASTIVR